MAKKGGSETRVDQVATKSVLGKNHPSRSSS